MNANVEALPDPIRLNVVSDASGRHLGFPIFQHLHNIGHVPLSALSSAKTLKRRQVIPQALHTTTVNPGLGMNGPTTQQLSSDSTREIGHASVKGESIVNWPWSAHAPQLLAPAKTQQAPLDLDRVRAEFHEIARQSVSPIRIIKGSRPLAGP